jgi:hypothetical protein
MDIGKDTIKAKSTELSWMRSIVQQIYNCMQ